MLAVTDHITPDDTTVFTAVLVDYVTPATGGRYATQTAGIVGLVAATVPGWFGVKNRAPVESYKNANMWNFLNGLVRRVTRIEDAHDVPWTDTLDSFKVQAVGRGHSISDAISEWALFHGIVEDLVDADLADAMSIERDLAIEERLDSIHRRRPADEGERDEDDGTAAA